MMSPSKKSTQSQTQIPFDELYRILSDQAGDAIFVLDLKGKILYANPAVKEVAGYSPTDYIGQYFEGFIEKASLAKAWEFFEETKKSKAAVRDELNVVDKDGNVIPVEFTVSPIVVDGKIKFIHSIVRNVSQKKLKEDIVRGAEKLKTVQHFIAGTIKEVEHPLRIVFEHLEALLKKYKERGFEYVGYKEYKDILASLDLMRDKIKDCFEITHKLLLINRKKAGITQVSCDANSIIKEIVSIFEHELKASQVKLKLELARPLPQVAIGSLELHQVLINILNNAIQAIIQGGTITLKTSRSGDGKFVLIECKDTGMGISKEALKHVFEPFFSTKNNEGRNLGLGLSIVYSILRSVNGQIQLKSSLRQGTSVIISVPIKVNK
jgi:PAS domain S-box-containing protein